MILKSTYLLAILKYNKMIIWYLFHNNWLKFHGCCRWLMDTWGSQCILYFYYMCLKVSIIKSENNF